MAFGMQLLLAVLWIVPVWIESIGCGQGVLGRYRFESVGAINDKESIELLFWRAEEEY